MIKKPYKILVVDDDEAIRDICQRYLIREGYDVVTASDGDIAFEKYKKQGADLVLTDLVMLEMDGFELCNKIREINPKTKLCMMSGGGYKQNFHKILNDLNINFLKKPYDLSELGKFIKKGLSEIEK